MELMDSIDTLIQERHLLGHPFYQQWVAGTLPLKYLREYARQYYAFESSFPRSGRRRACAYQAADPFTMRERTIGFQRAARFGLMPRLIKASPTCR